MLDRVVSLITTCELDTNSNH